MPTVTAVVVIKKPKTGVGNGPTANDNESLSYIKCRSNDSGNGKQTIASLKIDVEESSATNSA